MKREILFKAKRIDNGEWVYGKSLIQGIIKGREFCQIEQTDFDNYRQYECDINTICQFTGLLDKNGNKIFEGDIVNGKYEIFGTEDGKEYFATGKFKSHKSEIVTFKDGAFWAGSLMKGQEFEIISNIHDND